MLNVKGVTHLRRFQMLQADVFSEKGSDELTAHLSALEGR